MADKRYRVTVEFAHGVRHVLEVPEDILAAMMQWVDQRGRLFKLWLDGKQYFFNGDYLCSMVVEEVKEV